MNLNRSDKPKLSNLNGNIRIRPMDDFRPYKPYKDDSIPRIPYEPYKPYKPYNDDSIPYKPYKPYGDDYVPYKPYKPYGDDYVPSIPYKPYKDDGPLFMSHKQSNSIGSEKSPIMQHMPTKLSGSNINVKQVAKPIDYKSLEAKLFAQPNAKSLLVEEVISISRASDKTKNNIMWTNSMLTGYLSSKPKTNLVRPFFNDAESSIISAVRIDPKMPEFEFRKRVSIEIDRAYDSSLKKIEEEDKKNRTELLKTFNKITASNIMCMSASTSVSGSGSVSNHGHSEGVKVEHTSKDGKTHVSGEVKNTGDWHGRNNTSGEVRVTHKW